MCTSINIYWFSSFSFKLFQKSMGACISNDRSNHQRRPHSSGSITTSKHLGSVWLFSIHDFDYYLANGTVARNKLLNRSTCRPKWKSDVPITENQLRLKREEYWDTGQILTENNCISYILYNFVNRLYKIILLFPRFLRRFDSIKIEYQIS